VADVRTREYLTEAEVERLMGGTKSNRHGHRDEHSLPRGAETNGQITPQAGRANCQKANSGTRTPAQRQAFYEQCQ
jgi:hypothetical protein